MISLCKYNPDPGPVPHFNSDFTIGSDPVSVLDSNFGTDFISDSSAAPYTDRSLAHIVDADSALDCGSVPFSLSILMPDSFSITDRSHLQFRSRLRSLC
ncbi:hypothetical protein EVAR_84941_1 [Eumeta japonica]|uniref:Uncharacterized protein n=1 Tax=Eumeta variegata TaxID=151549 RepID=A0A4C1VJ65_EUMVA|nr:hypothetical protein EVAR_84941_1 [Eumeta japonica]